MEKKRCKGLDDNRDWAKLKYDLLVKIFMSFSSMDIISIISEVCPSWRAACCDRMLWHTVDLTELTVPIVNPQELYVCCDKRPSWRLMQALNRALTLSGNIVTRLIFHFYSYIRDEHLMFAADRCPNLKQLVLPAWNQITETGFQQAIQNLKSLESLTLPSDINFPIRLLQKIGANCPNLTKLKVMTPFDHDFATSLFINLPQLRVLSLRFTIVYKDALRITLMLFDHLKVVNITHSILVDTDINKCSTGLSWEHDSSILEKASCLEKFLLCQEEPCMICTHMIQDGGCLKWHEYEEGLWRENELSSFVI